jgi:hypothetical protein
MGRILRLRKDGWLVHSGEHTFVLVLYRKVCSSMIVATTIKLRIQVVRKRHSRRDPVCLVAQRMPVLALQK